MLLEPLLVPMRDNAVDNKKLIDINEIIRYHPIEMVGYELRASMTRHEENHLTNDSSHS